MIRRVIAALVAILLAAVGILLVVNYANRADERALAGMETDNVYVASTTIPQGTAAQDLDEFVETRAVPRQYQAPGRVTDIADLGARVSSVDVAAGEQLRTGQFATVDELRSRGEFDLPEEAQDLHQVTIPLDNPRALGGAVAPGDTVGVFGSFQVQTQDEYVLDATGNVERLVDDSSAESDGGEGVGDFSLTDLLMHKALVVRVEGGFVAPPPGLGQDDDQEAEDGAADTIHVTLALEAEEAARVVYAMEFGSVWLTLEPEGADDDEPKTIVITVPEQARNVVE